MSDGKRAAGERTPPPANRRRVRRILIPMLIALPLVAGGVWGLEMWIHHWREIPVSVNGAAQQVRVDTTLRDLLDDNKNFGSVPGSLIAVTGEVLKAGGGKPVAVTIDGHGVDLAKAAARLLPERAEIDVRSGDDVTESHAVRHDPVPYGVSIVGTGPIQVLRHLGKDGVREVWIGDISGKEVDKGVIEPPQDLLVETIAPRPTSRKVIALTFDDGPSQYSSAILDILRDKGAKATFFDIGASALNYPGVEQRMVAEGHQVASHSNRHPNMLNLSGDDVRADISAGLANLEKASGTKTRVFRAPYGNFGVDQWRAAGDLIDCNVLWTVDTQDWKRPGAQAIRDSLKKAYSGAIVLMHDGGGDRSQDVASLPGIIDDLKAQGYEFVTIDQLRQMQ